MILITSIAIIELIIDIIMIRKYYKEYAEKKYILKICQDLGIRIQGYDY